MVYLDGILEILPHAICHRLRSDHHRRVVRPPNLACTDVPIALCGQLRVPLAARIPVMKLSTQSVGLLLLTMVVPGCGGGVPEQTATRTAQEQQPAPQPLPVEVTGPGQIVGFVFEDRNRNGLFDANDTRRAQLTVVLTNPSGTQQIRSAITDADGSFRLENLSAGEYRVTLQIPKGFERTNDDSFVLTVNADETAREVQFGITPQKT